MKVGRCVTHRKSTAWPTQSSRAKSVTKKPTTPSQKPVFFANPPKKRPETAFSYGSFRFPIEVVEPKNISSKRRHSSSMPITSGRGIKTTEPKRKQKPRHIVIQTPDPNKVPPFASHLLIISNIKKVQRPPRPKSTLFAHVSRNCMSAFSSPRNTVPETSTFDYEKKETTSKAEKSVKQFVLRQLKEEWKYKSNVDSVKVLDPFYHLVNPEPTKKPQKDLRLYDRRLVFHKEKQVEPEETKKEELAEALKTKDLPSKETKVTQYVNAAIQVGKEETSVLNKKSIKQIITTKGNKHNQKVKRDTIRKPVNNAYLKKPSRNTESVSHEHSGYVLGPKYT